MAIYTSRVVKGLLTTGIAAAAGLLYRDLSALNNILGPEYAEDVCHGKELLGLGLALVGGAVDITLMIRGLTDEYKGW